MELHKFNVVSKNLEILYSIYNMDYYNFNPESFIKKIGDYDVQYVGKVSNEDIQSN